MAKTPDLSATDHEPRTTDTQPIAALSTLGASDPRERFRQVARIGVQVAEALDYAHQQGIIHRDIKPANILLDTAGKAWVTDFGLARIETGATLTISGDLLGTLRYMSPEQVLAKRIVVDHRTDVYSLGATLYELLTLTPVFPDQDRHELMRRIAFEEPPPLRKLNPSVPLELETIVLKAIEKNPNDRYDAAQEMADDLQRHLDDEPIRAKRSNLLQRATKWSRRHSQLLGGVVLLLLTLAIGLALSIVLVAQAAQRERQMAEQAQRERLRAEANFQSALEAMERLVARVSDELGEIPNTHRIRQELLQDALNFYTTLSEEQAFLEDETIDPALRYQTARAYMQVGWISESLGHVAQSEEAWRRAMAILEKLSVDFPEEAKYREDLAKSFGSLCNRLMFSDRHAEHLTLARKWIALGEKLSADFPTVSDYQRILASAHTAMAHALSDQERYGEAEKHARLSLAIRQKFAPENTGELAHAHHWLGAVLLQDNRLNEAETELRKALELREALAASNPEAPSHQAALAHVKSYLAELLMQQGKWHQAVPLYRHAMEIREQLLRDFPNAYEHARRLKYIYGGLGMALTMTKQTEEAEAVLRRRLAHEEKLHADFPGATQDPAGDLAWAHYQLGMVLDDVGRSREAADEFRRALIEFENALTEKPDVLARQWALAQFLADCPAEQFRNPERAIELIKQALQVAPESATFWRMLGQAQCRAGHAAAAIRALNKAMAFRTDGDPKAWLILAKAHWLDGDKVEANQWYTRAVTWIDQRESIPGDVLRYRLEAAVLLGIGAVSDEPSNEIDDRSKQPGAQRAPKVTTSDN